MAKTSRVLYASEPGLAVGEFRQVLVESGLGTIRPVDDAARLGAMLAAANLVVTARLDEPGAPLVGIARGMTDFAWTCYLSELAVSRVGSGARHRPRPARRGTATDVALILASVPEAAGFYERAGMERIADAFWYRRRR